MRARGFTRRCSATPQREVTAINRKELLGQCHLHGDDPVGLRPSAFQFLCLPPEVQHWNISTLRRELWWLPAEWVPYEVFDAEDAEQGLKDLEEIKSFVKSLLVC